ncbi:endonuclease MutS2 [bacterium]|nr:endonuclease MutS2 [bacterium]
MKRRKVQLYPKNLGEKLGFNRIVERISDLCHSPLGRAEAAEVQIWCDTQLIKELHSEAHEFSTLLQSQDFTAPDTEFQVLKTHIDRLQIAGAVLSEEQLLEIKQFLKQYAAVVKEFKRNREHFPTLFQMVSVFDYDKELLATIESVFDNNGQIRPEVSPELNRIRAEIKKTISVQDKKFEAILRKCRQEKWLSDEEQTIRNGRRVLAIISEHKRKLKGIVHDESATGKSTFIEPQSLVELGNDLFDLQQKERKEIYRILSNLCSEIRPYCQHMQQYQQIAGKVDFVKAKARLGLQLGAISPQMNQKGNLFLENAQHPLLKLSFAEQGRKVVPLNIELDQNLRVLIISGPNAGGKSICLKTIGLLQCMYQAGMPIPAESHSTLPVFEKLYLDMGDDQNLDNDLSTYSSHLKALKHFANFSDENTLFLLDEFGTGTDPQFGGTIAEGVLEHLVNKKAYGVATTHYSNLKIYAEKKEGVANASMMFDQAQMKPTYVLQVGRPGSSYAFEIAQRIGLNKSIIEYANTRLGNKADSFEMLVNKLEKEKLALERKLKEATDKENKYSNLLNEYKALKQSVKENKQKMALEYKTQLQNELRNANKRFEKALADLKSNKKSQDEIAREIRSKLRKDSDRVEDELKTIKNKLVPKDKSVEKLKTGDKVSLREGTETGEIQEIDGKHAVVAFNHLRTRVPLTELVLSSDKSKKKSTKGVNVSDFILEFKSQIDVRGLRAEEALSEVEQLVDQAAILNQSNLRVVHGRGDGILRKQIASFLKANPHVVSFEYEHADRGGDGVTIIKL